MSSCGFDQVQMNSFFGALSPRPSPQRERECLLAVSDAGVDDGVQNVGQELA